MSKSKSLLSLDPATATGWNYLGFNPENNGPVPLAHGTYNLEKHRFEGQGMAYLRFLGWLRRTIQTCNPDAVVFEEVPAHKGVHAAHVYGAITGNIMLVCDQEEVPYGPVPIATWKKLATGKGNAGKELVAQCFHSQLIDLGGGEWSQDAIDAYYIGWAGAVTLGWIEAP